MAAPNPAAMAQQQHSAVRVISAHVTSLARTDATVTVTAERRLQGKNPASSRSLAAGHRQRLVCRLVRSAGAWRVIEMRLVAEEPIAVEEQEAR